MSNVKPWTHKTFAVGTILFSTAIIGCDDAAAVNTCNATYPTAPATDGVIVHVSSCGSADADGSAKKPYATISAAVDALRENPSASKYEGIVLVAPGTYAENLALSGLPRLKIIGADKPSTYEDAAIILQAPNPNAVVVDQNADVTLEGVQIKGAARVGALARGGSTLTLIGSSIDGVTADSEGIGYGLSATEDSAIILQHSEVTAAAKIGVLVVQSRAIILQSSIHDNDGPGLRAEQASDRLQIEQSEFIANKQSGVALFNSRAIILQSTMSDTLADASGIADGLVAAGFDGVDAALFPTEIEVRESTLSNNGRAGVLASGAVARTIILQNNTISGNAQTATMGAGIWLQGGIGSAPESTIDGNTMSQNRFLALCMRGDTHGIILQNNMITGTALGTAFSGVKEIQLGDGVHVLAGASATISNNDISGNARLGLMLDNALGASTVISGNTFASNGEYGIAIQSTSNAPATTANTFMSNMLGDNAASPSYAVPDVDLVGP